MPGLYAKGDFDLAGFAVGAVERGQVLPRLADVGAGDVLIGVDSSGLHSNGYSLVRHAVQGANLSYASQAPFEAGHTLAEALLTPTRLYVKGALGAIRAGGVKAMAHITGGGITENLPRVLPNGLDAEIDLSAWTPHTVFPWLAKIAGIEEREMLRTFNCGIGLIVVAAPESAHDIIEALGASGDTARIVGKLAEGGGEAKVTYRNALNLA
jgi:phosphoribosylformylglycinamidine cyclo-ligase